ncbi:hypothetical protein ACQUFY_09285 [Robbsia andropogonis]|uniref:hypothetical protein n=1 Tax=Robbsia andropogonis TaxID=28092 RepID=UPI003D19DCFE
MQRIGTSDGLYHSGDQSNSVLGTAVTADVMNANQEELAAIVESAGFTLDASGASPANNAQVLQAIRRLIGSPVVLADVGAVNAYAAVNIPAHTNDTWKDDVFQRLTIKVTNTGPSTLSVDGLTAIPIYGLGLQPLGGGELLSGNTATFVRKTIAGVNGGSPIAILMSCAGAPIQIAKGVLPAHGAQLQQIVGNIGEARNLSASLLAAGTTLTYTADNLIVKTALDGVAYSVSNLNATIKSTASGAGGIAANSTMPASGFLAIYAIYNPSTSTLALLGVNATAAKVPEACGATMPDGYTASALVGVWPTSSSQFLAAGQSGRVVTFITQSVLYTTSAPNSPTAISLSAYVPKNARFISGQLGIYANQGSSTVFAMYLYSNALGFSAKTCGGYLVSGASTGGNFTRVMVSETQTAYYQTNTSAGTYSANINGYEF